MMYRLEDLVGIARSPSKELLFLHSLLLYLRLLTESQQLHQNMWICLHKLHDFSPLEPLQL